MALGKNDAIPTGCLFLSGCESDNFTVWFYAFHANNFMHSYNLWFVRGLYAGSGTIKTGSTNAPASVPPIPSPLDATNADIAQ